jgi:hypothetical protein
MITRSLPKNARPSLATWKSGASAPRTVFKINAGSRPRVRISRQGRFFSKLLEILMKRRSRRHWRPINREMNQFKK